jgi:hypothetical protein
MEHGGQLTHSCLLFVRCHGGPTRWFLAPWWPSWPAKILETRPAHEGLHDHVDLSLLPPDEAPRVLDFLW